MNVWIKRFANSGDPTERVVVLRQNHAFRRDYFPLRAELQLNDVDFEVSDRFAFLLKESAPPLQTIGVFGDFYLPNYRQVPFEPAQDGRMPSRRFRLPAPNQSEQLVVFVVVKPKMGKSLPSTIQGYGFRLSVVSSEQGG